MDLRLAPTHAEVGHRRNQNRQTQTQYHNKYRYCDGLVATEEQKKDIRGSYRSFLTLPHEVFQTAMSFEVIRTYETLFVKNAEFTC
jgi:hypothetical protein